jgi:hypothetical protein
LTDEETHARLRRLLEALMAWTQTLHAGARHPTAAQPLGRAR